MQVSVLIIFFSENNNKIWCHIHVFVVYFAFFGQSVAEIIR